MRTHNIGFYEETIKSITIYHQISSNTHLISSAAVISAFSENSHVRNLFIFIYKTVDH